MTAFTSCLLTCTSIVASWRFSSAFILVPSAPQRYKTNTRVPLFALVYGWDSDEDESDSYHETEVAPVCTPVGSQVAESLSYDPDRVGSLARLAVAFSPPERALKLDIIEKVDVICVGQDHIDIQAIVCEEGGCVSLSVPIRFPHCNTEDQQKLEGCVISHLDLLDSSIPVENSKTTSVDDENLDFPDWWVSSSCDAEVAAECTSMLNILNEDEFSSDIRALAQERLRQSGYELGHSSIQEAKVAAVGPAGFFFKVRTSDGTNLDVLYPFGETLWTVEDLRANVLGLVATA